MSSGGVYNPISIQHYTLAMYINPITFGSKTTTIQDQNIITYRRKAEKYISFSKKMIFLVLVALTISQTAKAGDPDILTDFILPPNLSQVDGNFFTFTGLRSLVSDPIPPSFKVLKANMEQLPALNGQSVSCAALVYPGQSVNPVHTHPRSAELLFVIMGSLEVGFMDSKNKLYTQTLQTGDMFVFPKGLVHYQYNADSKNPAIAISAFGSANPGTVSLPNTLFNSTTDDSVLALSFKTDVATIKKIKAGLQG